MRTSCMILARSPGASKLICSGVIERTLINIACNLRVTCLFRGVIGRIIPFDLRASSADVEVMPWQPVLEPAVPEEVAQDAEEGIPGIGGPDVGAAEGILGIVAV